MIGIELVDRRLRASSIESNQDAALNQQLAEIVDETAGRVAQHFDRRGTVATPIDRDIRLAREMAFKTFASSSARSRL